MNSYIIDIETVPAEREVLEARMPEELRNPAMPEELKNPVIPDFSQGCPAYASVKDPEARAAKQAAWITQREEKWAQSQQEARQKWELSVVEGRARFREKAALDARLGHAKLIGIKDVRRAVSIVYVWEEDPNQMNRIRLWMNSLPSAAITGEVVKVSGDHAFSVRAYRTEAEMIKRFFAEFQDMMDPEAGKMMALQDGVQYRITPAQCVTYYGNQFDFPFLYRRCWMLGIPQVPLFRRGRYWEDRMVDLHDIWQLGNREEKTGGLDNVAAALGYDRAKLHDGASFHSFYQEDPTEGIAYLLNDLACTEFVARRTGVIR